jgi:hypothetical protein
MITRKCPFCQQDLYDNGLRRIIGTHEEDGEYYSYSCNSINCMVNNDFPRYVDTIDCNGNIFEQEYALDTYYVKVGRNSSRIYQLHAAMLVDEVAIARPIWLNVTNFDQTLDKLKLWVIFS